LLAPAVPFQVFFVIQVTFAKNSSGTLELIHHPVSNLQSMGSLQNRPKKVMLQQQHRGPSHLLALGDKRNFTTSETGALSYDGGIHH